MIEIFAYENKDHKKSIKIVGITGRNDKNFGGISLGKVLLNSSLNLSEVLNTLKTYKPLDHMPKRGEGLPQYNECWKMFSNSGVYCKIGELDPNKVTAAELTKTINFLKGLSEDAQDELSESIKEGKSSNELKFFSSMPAPLIAILASAGTGEVGSAARDYYDSDMYEDTDGSYSSGSSSVSNNDSEVIKNLRALARSLGYDIVKL